MLSDYQMMQALDGVAEAECDKCGEIYTVETDCGAFNCREEDYSE